MIVAILPEVSEIRFADIPNTLEALQGQVGGYIETIRLSREIVAIVNEEGLLMGLPKNRHMNGIVGPAVLVRNLPGDEDFRSLTDHDISYLNDLFGCKKNRRSCANSHDEKNSTNQDQYTAESLKSQIVIVENIPVEISGRKYRLCYVPEEVLK